MYIGPDVKGVVEKNQIFTFDPEDKKKEAEKIYAPAVKLFVDIKDITVKRNELRREGSYLELVYRNFEKKVRRKQWRSIGMELTPQEIRT